MGGWGEIRTDLYGEPGKLSEWCGLLHLLGFLLPMRFGPCRDMERKHQCNGVEHPGGVKKGGPRHGRLVPWTKGVYLVRIIEMSGHEATRKTEWGYKLLSCFALERCLVYLLQFFAP